MTIHERPFGRLYEDFEPGDVYRHWPGKTITEADDHLFCMITMNHHPLHTDAWYAENETQFGKNVVVGNLVYSLVLGMSVPDVSGAAIANLEVESLQHKRPTFHGDTIYAETVVIEKRESSSRPDRGVVTVESRGFNQRGEEVCFFRRKVMVPKRDGRARARPAVHLARGLTADGRPGAAGCLFCSIVAGETPAAIVLDTPRGAWRSSTSARCSPGHTLVVPRRHVETLRDLDDATRDVLFAEVQRVAAAVQDAMGAQGSFVAMNNVVSQSVPHLHVHAVPRNRKDGLRGFFWPRTTLRRRRRGRGGRRVDPRRPRRIDRTLQRRIDVIL